jgi:hypothetical protein
MATLIAVLGTSCGGDDVSDPSAGEVSPPPPGVSSLDYSPKRISKDTKAMTVRFTTTGRAGPGVEYTAWLFTGEDDRDQDCWSEFGPRDGVAGDAGRTYEQVIRLREYEGSHISDPWHPCIGAARLVVWTQDEDEPGEPIEFMRESGFEIFPSGSD